MRSSPSRLLPGTALTCAVLAAAVPSSLAQPAAAAYYFTHFAGSTGGPGSADGPGTAARFYYPRGAALDPAGNVYVADGYNHTIRRIAVDGSVTTVAGKAGIFGSADGAGPDARFCYPAGVAVDKSGNLYVADWGNSTIRKIDPNGTVTTLAGSPDVPVITEADGFGPNARFAGPCGVIMDAAGNVLVADAYGETIRKVSPAGNVTTPVGPVPEIFATGGLFGGSPFETEWGSLVGAHLSQLASDSLGNVYTCDEVWIPASYGYPSYFLIQKVSPAGTVTPLDTPTGLTGNASGPGVPWQLPSLIGVAVDERDNLLVATKGGVIKVNPAGAGTSIATATPLDGTGAIMDQSGNVLVTDTYGNQVVKVAHDGTVTPLAGLAAAPGSPDGAGSVARFSAPHGIAVGKSGTIYVADSDNNTIRKITSAGVVSTWAGSATANPTDVDGTGAAANFDHPWDLAVDGTENVYATEVSGAVRKIDPGGVVTTLAGVYSDDGGLAVDGAGNVFVTTPGNRITRITPAGVVSILAGNGQNPNGAEVSQIDGTGTAAQFGFIQGLAVDSSGNIFATDENTIRRITPAGVVTTVSSGFRDPTGIAVDAVGNIFTVDMGTVRMLAPDGTVTTLAGEFNTLGSTDGLGLAAMFNSPTGLAVDGSGSLYIADTGNNSIRKGQLAGPPVITAQPASETAAPGATIQFSVMASGIYPLNYQWYFNGSALGGATSSSLILANVSAANAGDYTVIVVNVLGSATSTKATLTVSAMPAGPSGMPVSGGGATGAWFFFLLAALAAVRGVVKKPAHP